MKDDAKRAKVWLELTRGDSTISGHLSDGKQSLEFSGWLTLAAALERMRRKPQGDGEGPPGGAEGTDDQEIPR